MSVVQVSQSSIQKSSFEALYNELFSDPKFHQIDCGSYEVIEVDGEIEVQILGGKFVPVKWLSRHKTRKHLVEVFLEALASKKRFKTVTTTDHCLMVLNSDNFFEQLSSKDIRPHQLMSVYDEERNEELLAEVVSIEDLGTTEDYVYDLEVEDDSHAFYANGVYVHNSQFLNLTCITDWMKQKYKLPDKIFEWSDEMKLALWKFMDGFVEGKVNKFVQELVRDYCHTEHPEILRYSLEYIADAGIYEVKKHYICRKVVSEGPELVDKVKVTGIELKKATIPVAIKDILRDIYYSTLTKDWTSEDFNRYLLEAYEKFLSLSVNDVGMWMGWSSDKIPPTGFLKTGLGTTGISRACHYYNDLIKHLKLGKKYDELRLGGKYKFVYLNTSNPYGIDRIAFIDGQWPKEFDEIFKVDYQLMFEKSVKDKLRSFLEATGFVFKDPREREVFALDEL